MGSFDGAETCELVGSFLLSQFQHLNINVGLYRDDGLAIRLSLQKTFPPALTNDFHPCLPTKRPSTKPPLHTRRLSTKANITTPFNTNPPHLANEKTASATYSGTTLPSARTSALTSDTDSSL